MSRLLVVIFAMLLAGCGDNFDRDELMNGPRQPDGALDTDILITE
ncbi:MAG TPA: hypothetical protein PKH10_02770 [bacterium]|nr:hypothetical protein [bacterium]